MVGQFDGISVALVLLKSERVWGFDYIRSTDREEKGATTGVVPWQLNTNGL